MVERTRSHRVGHSREVTRRFKNAGIVGGSQSFSPAAWTRSDDGPFA